MKSNIFTKNTAFLLLILLLASPAMATTYFNDTFDRANSAAIGTADSGETWTDDDSSGTAGIQGDMLYLSDSGAGDVGGDVSISSHAYGDELAQINLSFASMSTTRYLSIRFQESGGTQAFDINPRTGGELWIGGSQWNGETYSADTNVSVVVQFNESNHTIMAVYVDGTKSGGSKAFDNAVDIEKIQIRTGGGESGVHYMTHINIVTAPEPTPPATGTLEINLQNIVNSTIINDFCVDASNGSTVTKCNTTGASVFFNSTELLQNTFYNFTSYNATDYFNSTLQNYNFTGSATLTLNTSQALLEVDATQLFTGNAINTFNITNDQTSNQTSSGSLIIPANTGTNTLNITVPGNFSQLQNCTAGSLNTTSCTITGIHDNQYLINASDIWNDETILNFTINVTNTTLGGVLYTESTTNGEILLSLLQGYNYFVQFSNDEGLYEYANETLEANSSSQYYTFEVLPTPSIDITIRDAADGTLITENITITLTSNSTGETVYTATGGYFATDLNPEQYTVKLNGANYSQSSYVVTAGQGTVYFLTAYLQQNTSEVIMQFVDSISTTFTITGAQVSQQMLINGSYQTVSSKLTDITGRTVFQYQDDVAYRFIAIADGYDIKTFTLDPVLFSSYEIKMTPTTSLDFEEDFQSVYINYEPKIFYDGQENTVNITFNSPLGTFVSYNYLISYPGGTSSGSGNTITGEDFSTSFNITGAEFLDTVNISLTYDTSIGTPRTFNYTNQILINPGNTTFIANQDNTYGLGLLERLLIGTVIIIGIAGLATIGAGSLIGLGIGLLLMGVWIVIGFWPWWAAGLSFLVGFALISGRSD